MKWVDISRWVYGVIATIVVIMHLWKYKKISTDNPNSSIWKELTFIELLIILIAILSTVPKISIVLCF